MTKTLLNAVTATTTSDVVEVGNLSRITIQILAAGISSGNGSFAVQGSNDGQNFDPLPVIRSLANTNGQQLTRDLSVALSTNVTEVLALDDFYVPKFIRVVLTFTTDGSYSAFLHGHKIT